jgi:hypothetical protein
VARAGKVWERGRVKEGGSTATRTKQMAGTATREATVRCLGIAAPERVGWSLGPPPARARHSPPAGHRCERAAATRGDVPGRRTPSTKRAAGRRNARGADRASHRCHVAHSEFAGERETARRGDRPGVTCRPSPPRSQRGLQPGLNVRRPAKERATTRLRRQS